MFDIIRRGSLDRPMRDLMTLFGQEPLFATWEDATDGNLAVDVAEGDGEIIVKASLPGFQKDDIEVQIHNGVLTIKAQHSEEKETKDERYYRRERRMGSVARRLALPGLISNTGATADLKDGVLTLRIPQAEEARPKQITVN